MSTTGHAVVVDALVDLLFAVRATGATDDRAERGATLRQWEVDAETGLLDIDGLLPLLNENTRSPGPSMRSSP